VERGDPLPDERRSDLQGLVDRHMVAIGAIAADIQAALQHRVRQVVVDVRVDAKQ